MDLLSIGQFAQASRLSPRALRLYDEMGLLRPVRVDEASGYRWYAPEQVERARLVASLRQLDVPLARIAAIVDAEEAKAGELVAEYWATVEAEHADRRALAGYLVTRFKGGAPTMYEVAVRDIPTRSLLTLQRHLTVDEMMSVGKGFIDHFRDRSTPRVEGAAGELFLIYYGEVSKDSDGPIEWCRPVPDDQAAEIAARFPDLGLRVEPAHQEAYVHVGSAMGSETKFMPAFEAITAWLKEERRQIAGAFRQVYISRTPPDFERGPDCDFAVPVRPMG